jgi:oxygen-independent coproporphyrinogen-3 oxidase
MVGTGVASFSHVGGVHYQNEDKWEHYLEVVDAGRMPLMRAMRPTAHQLLVRELILQLKLGRLDLTYFRNKFGVEPRTQFAEGFDSLVADGYAKIEGDRVALTRDGLLRVDALLPRFFEPEHRGIRYT